MLTILFLVSCVANSVITSDGAEEGTKEAFQHYFDAIVDDKMEEKNRYGEILREERVMQQQNVDAAIEERRRAKIKNSRKIKKIKTQHANIVKRQNALRDAGKFPTERNARRYVQEFPDRTSNVEVFTKYPHPHEPLPPIPGDDWNTNMEAPFPVSENEVEMKIDKLFNEFVRIMSDGERIKITVLTTNHEWFTQKALTCYDHLRETLTEHCVDDKKHAYALKYRFVLMNLCNASWLTEEKIEGTMKSVCETAKVS